MFFLGSITRILTNWCF